MCLFLHAKERDDDFLTPCQSNRHSKTVMFECSMSAGFIQHIPFMFITGISTRGERNADVSHFLFISLAFCPKRLALGGASILMNN